MKCFNHNLTKDINLKFNHHKDSSYWAELVQNDNSIPIPLLLTETEAIQAVNRLKGIPLHNYPIGYLRMIVAGCIKITISGVHL